MRRQLILAAFVCCALLAAEATGPIGGPGRASAASPGNVIAAVDTSGTVGLYTSLALDSSGNPVISYYDVAGGMKVAHCGNPTCTSGNSVLKPDANGGVDTSIVLDSFSRPVISYYDNSVAQNLSVLHCDDVNCSGVEIPQQPDTAGDVGWATWIALDSSGFPVVTYYYATGGDLRVLHCNDANCDPAVGGADTFQTPDGASSNVGSWTGLALDGSGFPVVAYYDVTNGNLKLMHCNDAACAGNNESIITTDASANDVGRHLGMVLDSSGFPVVSYYDLTSADLKVLHCNDANCDPAVNGAESITTPDSAGDMGAHSAIVLDAAGNPVISYLDFTSYDLKILHCGDPNCSSGNVFASPDTFLDVGAFTSIKLDSAGRPVVAYSDVSATDLMVLHCGDVNCSSPLTFTVNDVISDASDINAGDGFCAIAVTVGAVCTLRAAIEEANAFAGTQMIAFNISGTPPFSIAPTSALPDIVDPVIIDGYTQPGASANTAPFGSPGNAVLKIELNGTSAGVGVSGLEITGGGSTVRGLAINRFATGNGITLLTNGGNAIQNGFSIFLGSGADNIIGGFVAGAGNLISGNAIGLYITGMGESGAGCSGAVDDDFDGVPNDGCPQVGPAAETAAQCTNGVDDDADAAVNDGCPAVGGATNTIVQGNSIGINAAGTGAIANGSNGILLIFGARNTIIGGTSQGSGNTIAYNSGIGVITGDAGTGNTIRGNSIYSNTGLGIDLGANGVTANDAGDGDSGANNLQNFPLLTSAETGSAIIKGTFNSTASSIFLLDFYASTSCDGSGNGEGQTYLGTVSVVTDGSGNATFEAAFDAPLAAGQAVTATATDAAGNTSEFSLCSTATLPVLTKVIGTAISGDCTNGTAAGACAVNQPRGLFEIYPPGGVVAGAGEAASAVSSALYWADTGNSKVKKLEPATATDPVTTVAGGGGSLGDGGAATSAQLAGPRDVFIAGKSLYIADTNQCRIRRVDLVSGVITTVAGTGACGYNGDGAAATSTQLNSPRGVAVDSAGNLYVADTLNHRVRRIEHGGDGAVTGGAGETVSTIADTGTASADPTAANGDGGPATAATLNQPHDLYFLAEDLVIADTTNNKIRRIDYPAGTILTTAGTGAQGYSGDSGPGTLATAVP